MFGVELAVVGITCLVMIVLLLTSPWWMRALSAIVRAVWRQISQTDSDVVVRTLPKDVVDGEFREVDK
jgi:hypothetical protein